MGDSCQLLLPAYIGAQFYLAPAQFSWHLVGIAWEVELATTSSRG
jgi:hypothetical protein